MGPTDVFIKGGNAVDSFGQAWFLLEGAGEGAIGHVWGHITANGVTSIIAIVLEKLVPVSLSDIVPKTGIKRVDASLRMAVGMMVVGGNIITEMESFKILAGFDVYPSAGGGVDRGKSSKTFLLEGEEKNVKAAYDLVCSVKGEPALKTKVQDCKSCSHKCLYNENA